ncbi:helix-turn-helix transcriptional regulator [Cumulibacter soli]|uniref:helix-turn-helix transcriptional regulator n=1 Tax=Cumulibacter soli TaxID=2546344 RepID=UPI001067D9EA|nr:helix-turn-helix transcriptional regulator [Cumulibacter soli]
MREEVPAQWRDLFEGRGLESGRDLAKAIDVAPETARRLINGMSVSRGTLETAAKYFRVPEEQLQRLRGEESAGPPFRLPREADRLTSKQRRVVLSVVDALLEKSEDSAGATVADLDAARSPFDPKANPPEPNMLHDTESGKKPVRRAARKPPKDNRTR